MPVSPSPAVGRIARLLSAIAEAPNGELSLAELARRTAISKPTAHSLLLGMAEVGFIVRREPQPTYRLGPALVALGNAARGAGMVVAAAEPELVRLRDQLQLSTMAGAVEVDDVVVLAAHCVPHPFGYEVKEGHRLPFRAPIGPIYVAWSDQATIRGWCDRSRPALTERRRRALRRDLASIRQRGWSATVVRHAPDGRTLGEATDDDLGNDALTVVGISAPVWDGSGSLACSLALVGVNEPLSGARVRELAAHLTGSATRVTEKLCG